MLYVSSETPKRSVQAQEKPQALQRALQTWKTWNFLIFGLGFPIRIPASIESGSKPDPELLFLTFE
jgi:hypothetical protein